jgi:hypothetical protein
VKAEALVPIREEVTVIRHAALSSIVISAALFSGCGQAPDATESSSNDTSTADSLLGGVHACMSQTTCAADAGAGSHGCSLLGSCLSGFTNNAGAYDGGFPGVGGGFPGNIGGGLPGIGGFTGIGNGIPGLGNGLPGLGNGGIHLGDDGGVSTAVACLTDLGSCLKAQTNPTSCAQQVIQCLGAAK